jgi:spoIIIJ-associated protein
MPKSIEAQGVTVDEAIQTALNLLGLGRDSVEIEIIHHPRSGFLGIGARRAKVRATMREQVMKDGEEFDMAPDAGSRGRRRRRTGRRRTPRGGGEPKPRDSRPSAADSTGRRPGAEPRAAEPTPRAGKAAGVATAPGGSERSAGEQRGRGRGRRGGRGRGGAERRGPSEAEATVAPEAVRTGRDGAVSAAGDQQGEGRARPREQGGGKRLDPEMLRARAQQLTSDLIGLMGVDATVSVRVDESGDIAVAVQAGEDGAVLIGRRGTTLDALEHIINRMTTGADPAARIRVTLDVCGYRDRRRAALSEVAIRLKEHAISSMRRVQITPLSPHDRVIFQEALAGDDSVATRIVGSGFYRRVLVIPRGQENAGGTADEFNEDGQIVGYPASGVAEDEPVEEQSAEAIRSPDSVDPMESEQGWDEPSEVEEEPRGNES